MITYIGIIVAATGESICVYILSRALGTPGEEVGGFLQALMFYVALAAAVAIAFCAWGLIQASGDVANVLQ